MRCAGCRWEKLVVILCWAVFWFGDDRFLAKFFQREDSFEMAFQAKLFWVRQNLFSLVWLGLSFQSVVVHSERSA